MGAHCCEAMVRQVDHVCEQHPGRFECPDQVVGYFPEFDEYGLLLRDGTMLVIQFCPWCGKRLPESKRNLWVATLEGLGFDSPLVQDVPQEFRSDRWWKKWL